jgi:hypothetical protein
MTANQIAETIAGFMRMAVGYGLLALLAAMVAQAFGVRLPTIPVIPPATAVYLFGCWYLLRGAS